MLLGRGRQKEQRGIRLIAARLHRELHLPPAILSSLFRGRREREREREAGEKTDAEKEREREPWGEAPPSVGVCICARWRRSRVLHDPRAAGSSSLSRERVREEAAKRDLDVSFTSSKPLLAST